MIKQAFAYKEIIQFLLLFVFSMAGVSAQKNPSQVLIEHSWQIVSIDSGGQEVIFPNEAIYKYEIVPFYKKRCKKCKSFWWKSRKKMKKDGYDGLMVYTNAPFDTKYYCQIRAYCKILDDGTQIKMLWDDNFKTQERLSLVNEKINYWTYAALNGTGTISIIDNDTIEVNLDKYGRNQKRISMKLRLKKIG